MKNISLYSFIIGFFYLPPPLLYLLNFLILLVVFSHPFFCFVYQWKLRWWDWLIFIIFISWNLINYALAVYPPIGEGLRWRNNWPQLIVPFLNMVIVSILLAYIFLKKKF